MREKKIGFALLPDVPHFGSACRQASDLMQRSQSYRKSENFLVECGSLNMITQNQLDYAEEHGFFKNHMTVEQKLQKGLLQHAGRAWSFAQNAGRM